MVKPFGQCFDLHPPLWISLWHRPDALEPIRASLVYFEASAKALPIWAMIFADP